VAGPENQFQLAHPCPLYQDHTHDHRLNISFSAYQVVVTKVIIMYCFKGDAALVFDALWKSSSNPDFAGIKKTGVICKIVCMKYVDTTL